LPSSFLAAVVKKMSTAFALGDAIAKALLYVLPSQWSTRIQKNCGEVSFLVLKTGKTKTKRKMTLIEGVFATLLFDLAIFNTDNFFINFIIRTFTRFQNSWDRPFINQSEAKDEVGKFCENIGIEQTPWVWDKQPQEYKCLNDFFSRTYAPAYAPSIGDQDVVSPACCTMSLYSDNGSLQRLLIKGCDYALDKVGLWPPEDLTLYAKNKVLLGYLSPSDYHRCHAPIEGKVVHLKMEDSQAMSASVKFWGGKFNLLNKNKRLVVVIESTDDRATEPPTRVALVVVGGVGVDTIVYDPNMLGKSIEKGGEISTFRAGGSAIAMFSNTELNFRKDFLDAVSTEETPVQVMVGESLAQYSQKI